MSREDAAGRAGIVNAIGWKTWQTLTRGHPHQLACRALAHIARMVCWVDGVGDPAPDPVKLDAEDDLVAAEQGLAFAERQVLGREHLQLQWNGEPVLRTAGAEA